MGDHLNAAFHQVVDANNLEALAAILSYGGFDFNSRDKNGHTALYKAISLSNINMLSLLLKHGAWPNLCQREIAVKGYNLKSNLAHAINLGNSEVVKMLVSSGADVNYVPRSKGSKNQHVLGVTALYQAVRSTSLDILLQLLEAGADPNLESKWGDRPLHCACRLGQTEMVEALLTRGAHVNMQNCNGKTPMHALFQREKNLSKKRHPLRICKEILLLLLRESADVNLCDAEGNTPLHLACELPNAEMLAILLPISFPVNSNGQMQANQNMVHHSSSEPCCGSVRLETSNANDNSVNHVNGLCEFGDHHFDFVSKDTLNTSSAQHLPELSVCNGDNNCVSQPLDGDTFQQLSNNSVCQLAVMLKNLSVASDVQWQRFSPPRNCELTALDNSASIPEKCERTSVTQSYFDIPVSPNTRDRDKSVADCSNIWGGKTETLLPVPAVNICNRDGQTPLHVVVKGGDDKVHQQMALHLLLNGAKVNLMDRSNQTPLHMVLRSGQPNLQMIQLLLGFGADVNASKRGGDSTFLYALQYCQDSRILQYLLSSADISKENLHKAVLICSSCDHRDTYHHPNHRSRLCCRRGEILNYLLDRGIAVDFQDPTNGHFPLYKAVASFCSEKVEKLLKAGADTNMQIHRDYGGTTALHLSLTLLRPFAADIPVLLIRHGANMNKVDSKGINALEKLLFSIVSSDVLAFTEIPSPLEEGPENLQVRMNMVHHLVSCGASLMSNTDTKDACYNNESTQQCGNSAQYSFIVCYLGNTYPDLVMPFLELMSVAQGTPHVPTFQPTEATLFCGYVKQSNKPLPQSLLDWLMEKLCQPASLRDLARSSFRQYLCTQTQGCSIEPYLDRLGLPTLIKDYLLLKDIIVPHITHKSSDSPVKHDLSSMCVEFGGNIVWEDWDSELTAHSASEDIQPDAGEVTSDQSVRPSAYVYEENWDDDLC